MVNYVARSAAGSAGKPLLAPFAREKRVLEDPRTVENPLQLLKRRLQAGLKPRAG